MKYKAARVVMQEPGIIDATAQFATSPACQQICVREYKCRPSHVEIIRIESGVKISDLISLDERLDENIRGNGNEFGWINHHLRCRYCFEILWFEDTAMPPWVSELQALKGRMKRQAMERKGKRALERTGKKAVTKISSLAAKAD